MFPNQSIEWLLNILTFAESYNHFEKALFVGGVLYSSICKTLFPDKEIHAVELNDLSILAQSYVIHDSLNDFENLLLKNNASLKKHKCKYSKEEINHAYEKFSRFVGSCKRSLFNKLFGISHSYRRILHDNGPNIVLELSSMFSELCLPDKIINQDILKFEGGNYDLIISNNVVDYVPYIDFLRKCKHLLSDIGLLQITSFSKYPHFPKEIFGLSKIKPDLDDYLKLEEGFEVIGFFNNPSFKKYPLYSFFEIWYEVPI